MKTKPILFTTEMVQDILAGKKTQTRRLIKPQPNRILSGYPMKKPYWKGQTETEERIFCPYGQIGDLLWVRETFLYRAAKTNIIYKADISDFEAAGFGAMYGGWKPSMHMKRCISRITLKITDIQVERLQAGGDKEFWGKKVWKENPFVWVIQFEVHKMNIDDYINQRS